MMIHVNYVKGVTEIKLTVYDANGHNKNAVINEIRVPSEWKSNAYDGVSLSMIDVDGRKSITKIMLFPAQSIFL